MKCDEPVIAVAAHRPCRLPTDALYWPMHVGAAIAAEPLPGLLPDNTGENLSSRNALYCELCAQYWLWRNVEAPAYGLCHYRRYLGRRRIGGAWSRLLRMEDAVRLLEREAIILPARRHYWIETNASQYIHAHQRRELICARSALGRLHGGEAQRAFDMVMARCSGHRFNLFLMRAEAFQAWCAWLFPVLFAVEEELQLDERNPADRRVPGYLAERLLDVWLEAEERSWLDVPVVHTQPQHWPRKVAAFLDRKWRGERQENLRKEQER